MFDSFRAGTYLRPILELYYNNTIFAHVVFRFIWKRVNLAKSESTIEWDVTENTQPGIYRIHHYGFYKYIFGGVYAYEGVSNKFEVS